MNRHWLALAIGAVLSLSLAGCDRRPSFTIGPDQLPGATVGQAYDVPIVGTYPNGGNATPLSLTLDSGALPPGLTLRHTYEGPYAAILGTPTTAGTYTFELRAGSEGCTMAGCPYGMREYTLVVAP